MSELIVIIRPSFMKFCKDGCRAALFNHILYWISKKAKDEPQEAIQSGEVTWYAKNEALTQQMADAWGSEKVRTETNNLVKMGLIGRGRNSMFGADRTKHFYFGKEQCEKLFELCHEHEICLACLGLDNDIVHLIKTVKQICNPRNANHESVKCFVCPKHEHFWDSGLANHESVKAITKISTKTFTKETDKEASTSTVTQQTQTSPRSDVLSPSPSKKLIEDWFAHFDQLYRKKSGIANYRYSRRDTKIKDAIVKLMETGATFEQVEFVFNDIWDDKDAFWQEHKGKVWVVESQFATRVAKINAAAQKRRTASGFASYTEDKSIGLPAEAIGLSVQTTQPSAPVNEQPTPDQEQPKQPTRPKYGPKQDEAPTYQRLPQQRVVRPRSLFARQQAAKEAQEGAMK